MLIFDCGWLSLRVSGDSTNLPEHVNLWLGGSASECQETVLTYQNMLIFDCGWLSLRVSGDSTNLPEHVNLWLGGSASECRETVLTYQNMLIFDCGWLSLRVSGDSTNLPEHVNLWLGGSASECRETVLTYQNMLIFDCGWLTPVLGQARLHPLGPDSKGQRLGGHDSSIYSCIYTTLMCSRSPHPHPHFLPVCCRGLSAHQISIFFSSMSLKKKLKYIQFVHPYKSPPNQGSLKLIKMLKVHNVFPKVIFPPCYILWKYVFTPWVDNGENTKVSNKCRPYKPLSIFHNWPRERHNDDRT